jgi:hypothetical protein
VLLFALITLAPTLAALALLNGRSFERGLGAPKRSLFQREGRPGAAIVTFGRVPFFFYVLQWPTARLASILVTSLEEKSSAPYFLNILQIIQLPNPPDIGGPLWVTYLMDGWGLPALLAMPVVRAREGAQTRLVAELRLTAVRCSLSACGPREESEVFRAPQRERVGVPASAGRGDYGRPATARSRRSAPGLNARGGGGPL